MHPRFFVTLAALISISAWADEGELFVGAEATPGWFRINNQKITPDGYSSVFIQRFAIPVAYGLTDIWNLGISPGAAFGYGDVISEDVRIGNVSGNLHSGLLWLTFPITTSFRVNTGSNWSTTFEFFGGYSAAYWSDRFLEKNGFLLLDQKDLEGRWNHGPFFGAQILLEGRFFEALVIQGGPSISASYMDGWGFFPGFVVRLSGAVGVGSGLSARAE